MKIKIDKSKVTHLKIHNATMTNYKWKEGYTGRQFFGLYKYKFTEGYYECYNNVPCNFAFSREEIENSNQFTDIWGTLWNTPSVKIFINNECVGYKWFPFIENAYKYCKQEFPNVNYTI